MTALPASAEIVIIGGGVIGCSVAYHLTQAGLARRRAARAGAAVLRHHLACRRARRPAARAPEHDAARAVSAELYARLEAETGQATGWKQCGSIIVARTPERMTLFKRIASRSATRAGRRLRDHLGRGGARESYPMMRDRRSRSARCGCRATARPIPPTSRRRWRRARAWAARRIFEKTQASRAIRRRTARATGVATARRRRSRPRSSSTAPGSGRRRSGGMCGRHRAAAFGRAHVHRHRPHRRRAPGPAGAARSGRLHLRQGGGRRPARWAASSRWPSPGRWTASRRTSSSGMLPDDWDQFQILMENALIRLPALETAEIKTFMNGPESFTPDNNFIMGEAPELKNFFVAAGFNSIGIASRRRRRPGARRVDRRRRADARPVAGRHPPLRALPRQRHATCGRASARCSACTT